MVRELLDQEVEVSAKTDESAISRANYDFVFLRQEHIDGLEEYVLLMVPKRKEEYLFRGQIWVDSATYRVRRMEGVPVKNPSFWISSVHVTMQFAQVSGMWIPVSVDAIATVRFLGQYTISGFDIPADQPIIPKP